jgi:hypothetical protein
MVRFRLLTCTVSLLATSCIGSTAYAFGALAVDTYRGPKYGYSYNYPDATGARARALKECGNDCTVVLTYENTCAAFAADQSRPNGATGWAWAPTKEQAQSSALDYCKKYGGTWCLVRVWACEGNIANDARAHATREATPPPEPTTVAAAPPTLPPEAPKPPPAPPAAPKAAVGAPASTPPPSGPESQPDPKGMLEIILRASDKLNAPPEQKVMVYLKSKALVIGNDAYEVWPKLSNGVRDADEVAKGLAAQGFDVTVKRNLKSDELERVFKNFFIYEGIETNSRLLVWFAGHGETIDGEGYIVPVDAPSAKTNDAAFRDKALSLRRFSEYMRQARSRHVLAVFDSCFAGTVFNVARSDAPPAITLATTQQVRQYISSGDAEQQVSDNGMFRKLFLDALAGKEPDADANHDGYITGTELGLFLQQKMTNLTYTRQTPRYGKLNELGLDRGDFVFEVGKLVAPASAPQAGRQQ